MPLKSYRHSMAFCDEEDEFEIATHSLSGLMREKLIDDGWSLGFSKNYSELGGTPDLEKGIIYGTSIVGIELYLWAMGIGKTPINSFLEKKNLLIYSKEFDTVVGAITLVPKNNKTSETQKAE